MTTIPRTDYEAVQFFLINAPEWEARAAEIGLSVAEARVVRELAEAAAAARAAAFAAKQAAETATMVARGAIEAMRERGGAAIGKIRAFAASERSSEPLGAAGLPARSTRRAALPPARPRIVESGLNQLGGVSLRWVVRHTLETRAGGTQYMVERRVACRGEWAVLGTVGAGKRFTDAGVPVGAGSVEYRVTARRAGGEVALSDRRVVWLGSVGRVGGGNVERVAA